MKKCCFIVAFAILLSVIAPSIPAYAASEPINVMLGADCIRTVNVDTNKYSASSYGGVSDPSKMTDELYGVGPTNKDEGFNTRTIDKWIFYDADGNEDLYNGDYLWSVTFDLNGAYTIDTLSSVLVAILRVIGTLLLILLVTGTLFTCIFAYYVKTCLTPELDISLEDLPG